jgi:hypothetical protein
MDSAVVRLWQEERDFFANRGLPVASIAICEDVAFLADLSPNRINHLERRFRKPGFWLRAAEVRGAFSSM